MACNSQNEILKPNTYLIAKIFESESKELSRRHSSDTKVEPSAVVLSLHVRGRVAGHPKVERVFLETSLGPGQIATAKLAVKHNL